MAALTEAQKKKLKAHSKSQTPTHIKAMAKLMRAGKSFSEAHASVSKKSVQQKQKQKQSQKVVVNIGTIPRRRGRKPRAKPRPMSYQQDTARVLAQFATPFGMPQQFNPPPTIYETPKPQPFRPEVSQASPKKPDLVDLFKTIRPVSVPQPEEDDIAMRQSMRQERMKMLEEDINSRRARRNANLDDTPQQAAEKPSGLSAPAPLGNRQISDITTAPNTPFREDPFDDDEATY